MSSAPEAVAAATAQSTAASAIPTEPVPQDGTMEADDENDSGCGDSIYIDTTSISSSVRRGIIENGRRYQTLHEGEYWGPADDKQFEAMNLCHLVHLTLDCQQEDALFRSPGGEHFQNILDLGTGQGEWCIDTADRYPGAIVRVVGLFPPPHDWVPTNCIFEVDDVLKHCCSFTLAGWKGVYKQAYDNLEPGGWIEQIEPGLDILCDDGTLPADSKCAAWGPMFTKLGAKTGRPLDNIHTMKASIKAAGVVNIQEEVHKVPSNPWARHPIYQEAGRLHLEELRTGIEGYALHFLTTVGEPSPWSAEEAREFSGGVKE